MNVPAFPRMIGLPPLGVAVPVLVTVAEMLSGFAASSSLIDVPRVGERERVVAGVEAGEDRAAAESVVADAVSEPSAAARRGDPYARKRGSGLVYDIRQQRAPGGRRDQALDVTGPRWLIPQVTCEMTW